MSPRTFSDFTLERYVLGELSNEDQAAVEAALANSPELSARVAALRTHNEEFLTRHPFLPPRAAPARTWRKPALALLTCCAAAALFWIAAPRKETIRLKGDTLSLNIHAKPARGAARQLLPGDSATASERLQIGYMSTKALQGIILSCDSRDTLSPHLTSAEGGSVALAPNLNQMLPSSFELDDTPGFEDFYFIAAEKPFPLTSLGAFCTSEKRAENLAGLKKRGYTVEHFPVRKH